MSKIHQTFHVPILIEDLKYILRESLLEPIRIRGNDGKIFAKRNKELIQKIVSLDNLFDLFFHVDNEGRILNTVSNAKYLGLLHLKGKEGKDLRYEITPMGRAWLGFSDKKRLVWILNQHFKKTKNLEDFDIFSDEYEEHLVDFNNSIDFLPNHYMNFSDFDTKIEKKIIEIFQNLKIDDFHVLEEFIDKCCKPSNNPYTNLPKGMFRIARLSKHQAELIWRNLLQDFLFIRLLPLGGIKLGVDTNQQLYFAMTDIGHYFLGTRDHFEYPIHAQDKVIVQPNYEIIFLEPSSYAEYLLTPLAQRTGKNLGNVFKITKESIKKAAFFGIDVDTILSTLQTLSQKNLPQNVVHEIQEWHGNTKTISIHDALIIHCPDSETAQRVKKLGGKNITTLTENILQCSDLSEKTKLSKKLNKEGIFVS